MIPHVPATQAKLKTHNRILSSTIATYFQSSETWEKHILVEHFDHYNDVSNWNSQSQSAGCRMSFVNA